MENFQDLDYLTPDEVIGSLKIHEYKVRHRFSKREKKILLACGYAKSKKREGGCS